MFQNTFSTPVKASREQQQVCSSFDKPDDLYCYESPAGRVQIPFQEVMNFQMATKYEHTSNGSPVRHHQRQQSNESYERLLRAPIKANNPMCKQNSFIYDDQTPKKNQVKFTCESNNLKLIPELSYDSPKKNVQVSQSSQFGSQTENYNHMRSTEYTDRKQKKIYEKATASKFIFDDDASMLSDTSDGDDECHSPLRLKQEDICLVKPFDSVMQPSVDNKDVCQQNAITSFENQFEPKSSFNYQYRALNVRPFNLDQQFADCEESDVELENNEQGESLFDQNNFNKLQNNINSVQIGSLSLFSQNNCLPSLSSHRPQCQPSIYEKYETKQSFSHPVQQESRSRRQTTSLFGLIDTSDELTANTSNPVKKIY